MFDEEYEHYPFDEGEIGIADKGYEGAALLLTPWKGIASNLCSGSLSLREGVGFPKASAQLFRGEISSHCGYATSQIPLYTYS